MAASQAINVDNEYWCHRCDVIVGNEEVDFDKVGIQKVYPMPMFTGKLITVKEAHSGPPIEVHYYFHHKKCGSILLSVNKND